MSPKKLSREAYDRLVTELDHLRTVERELVAEEVVTARQAGSILENGDYFAAKEKEGILETRIRNLEDSLRAVVIEDSLATNGSTIGHGSVVTILFDGEDDPESYIVAEVAERTALPVCSPSSPLGSVLLGREAGAVVSYNTPRGKQSVTVVEVA